MFYDVVILDFYFIYLLLSATTSGKDNSMESLVIFDKVVKEHIWRDFGPFLLAYPFKILHILGFVLIN